MTMNLLPSRSVCRHIWKQLDAGAVRLAPPQKALLRQHMGDLCRLAGSSRMPHAARVVASAALRATRCRAAIDPAELSPSRRVEIQWPGVAEQIRLELRREAGDCASLSPQTAHAYARLRTEDAEFLQLHASELRELWKPVRHPSAESVALDAAVRALSAFKPGLHRWGTSDPDTARWQWIRMKVTYALRELANCEPRVRNGFLDFQRLHGHAPSLPQLCAFAGLTPREVLSVWAEVAAELELHGNRDPILASLPLPEPDSPSEGDETLQSHERVRRVLKQLSPFEASLLILRFVAERSDAEILGFIHRVRRQAARSVPVATLQAALDKFAGTTEPGLSAPWDHRLLSIQTPGQLRVLIHRAGGRFKHLFLKDNADGPTE